MNKQDKKQISNIILNLVKANIQSGATLEKAKEQAFNRLNKEYPTVLGYWLQEMIK